MELLVDGLNFGEGPRWHHGELWYSDFHQRAIYAVSPDGTRRTVHGDLPDQPSGLGWMPDGSLLAVAMISQKVWRSADDGPFEDWADLSPVATFHCNDMVVAMDGSAYVGNFGFDLHGGGTPGPADLAYVSPMGEVSLAAEEFLFPNGSVITPDGKTLIVGETMGRCYSAFDIALDGTLTNRRQWADLGRGFPDGCCLDADGAIWFADPINGELVRVLEGGEVTHKLDTPQTPFACMLGGPDENILYALCAPSDEADQRASAAGAIYFREVDVPRAGRP